MRRRSPYDIIVGGGRAVGTLIASPLLRVGYNTWGATPDEVARPMPGDELVPEPRLGYTRAVTIDAAAEDVWPWLIQLGQGRGGFYSYDGLENLVGCRIHSVDRILPQHQDPSPGELIRSGPGDAYAAWEIIDIDPPRSLVLLGADAKTGSAPPRQDGKVVDGSVASTWQWELVPVGEGVTRLVVRQRLAYPPTVGQRLLWRVVEPLNFVMEAEMMRGLKRRAEAAVPAEDVGCAS